MPLCHWILHLSKKNLKLKCANYKVWQCSVLCWFPIIQINYSILSTFAIEFANKCGKFMQIVWTHNFTLNNSFTWKWEIVWYSMRLRMRAYHNMPRHAYHTVTSHIYADRHSIMFWENDMDKHRLKFNLLLSLRRIPAGWWFKCGKMFAMFMEQQSTHYGVYTLRLS